MTHYIAMNKNIILIFSVQRVNSKLCEREQKFQKSTDLLCSTVQVLQIYSYLYLRMDFTARRLVLSEMVTSTHKHHT